MGYTLKQGQTARPLIFSMYLEGTLTPATGLSPTVTLSKNGAAYGAAAGSVSEIGNGDYAVAGNATDEGTLGPLYLYATAATADAAKEVFEVVAYDPDVAYGTADPGDEMDLVDAPNATAVTAFQNGLGTAANQTTIAGYIDTEIAAIISTLSTISGLIDTEIASLLTELAKVPKSDGAATWNATALASLLTQAAAALTAYDPPTKAELDTAIAAIPTVEEIRTEMDDNSTIASNVATLLGKLTGITLLSAWLRRMMRKDAGDADMTTAAAEIAVGGTPTYNGLTDNIQDVRDNSGGGGGGGGATVEEIVDGIAEEFGPGPYTKPSGTLSGSSMPTFQAVKFVYGDLSEMTIEVLDVNGDAVTLPDPDVEVMTLAIETYDHQDVYIRSTDDAEDPIEIDEDAGTITLQPSEALVFLDHDTQLTLSLRGANNREIARGSGYIAYSALNNAEEPSP